METTLPIEEQVKRAQLLQKIVVDVLAAEVSLDSVAEEMQRTWQGMGRLAIRHESIAGTFCQGSSAWDMGANNGRPVLDVLAETEIGPYELRLQVGDDNLPNFEFSAPGHRPE